jgi:hypothetical protein
MPPPFALRWVDAHRSDFSVPNHGFQDSLPLLGATSKSVGLESPLVPTGEVEGSRLFEISRPSFGSDHRARRIEHAQLRTLRSTIKFRVADSGIRILIPQTTKGQGLGD